MRVKELREAIAKMTDDEIVYLQPTLQEQDDRLGLVDAEIGVFDGTNRDSNMAIIRATGPGTDSDGYCLDLADYLQVRKAIELLNHHAQTHDPDLIAEEGCELSPNALAGLVRQHLPLDGAQLNPEQKLFWLRFADHLGPDWIDGLVRVSKFINVTSNA